MPRSSTTRTTWASIQAFAGCAPCDHYCMQRRWNLHVSNVFMVLRTMARSPFTPSVTSAHMARRPPVNLLHRPRADFRALSPSICRGTTHDWHSIARRGPLDLDPFYHNENECFLKFLTVSESAQLNSATPSPPLSSAAAAHDEAVTYLVPKSDVFNATCGVSTC